MAITIQMFLPIQVAISGSSFVVLECDLTIPGGTSNPYFDTMCYSFYVNVRNVVCENRT